MTGRTLLVLAMLALLPAAAEAGSLGPEELVGQPPRAPHRGTTLSMLAGVDGFAGELANQVATGPSWGLLVNVQPVNPAAIELLYSGAVHALDGAQPSGGQLLRQSGSVHLKFTFSPTLVEPYLFAGIGLGWAKVSGVPAESGWESLDFFGTVPLGGGVKAHFGRLTLGVRGGTELLLGEEFAPQDAQGRCWNGRFELGARF
jgi:hypothetical protein